MLVSVIIPCFNVENYIQECITSVINQTYKSIEIICVDNNSTDKTFSILEDLKREYPSLIHLYKESVEGAPFARNKGLQVAKGEYIQFLDADDLLMPNKIQHQIDLILNHKTDIGFIAAACIKKSLDNKDTVVSEIDKNIFLSPFINKAGNTCSNLWNKISMQNVGGWNEHIKSSQEADLMLRLVLNGHEFLIDNEPLTIVRERESGQISQRDPGKKWRQFIEIRLNYLDSLKKNKADVYNKYKNIFFDFLMVSVLTYAKYDKSEAVNIYNKYIKSEWISSGSYGFNVFKVILIKLIGLKIFLRVYL